MASASALGRGPVGGAVGLEFPSKGIRIPFEGNSKGTGSVLEVLCVVSGTSCNHHLGLPRIGCAFPSTVHFEGIRRGMDGDECVHAGGGVARRAAFMNSLPRRAIRSTYASAPRTLAVVSVSPERIVVDASGPNYRPRMTAEQGKKMRAERKHAMAVKNHQLIQELRARRRGGVDNGRVDAGGVGVRAGSMVASGGEAFGDDRGHGASDGDGAEDDAGRGAGDCDGGDGGGGGGQRGSGGEHGYM